MFTAIFGRDCLAVFKPRRTAPFGSPQHQLPGIRSWMPIISLLFLFQSAYFFFFKGEKTYSHQLPIYSAWFMSQPLGLFLPYLLPSAPAHTPRSPPRPLPLPQRPPSPEPPGGLRCFLGSPGRGSSHRSPRTTCTFSAETPAVRAPRKLEAAAPRPRSGSECSRRASPGLPLPSRRTCSRERPGAAPKRGAVGLPRTQPWVRGWERRSAGKKEGG